MRDWHKACNYSQKLQQDVEETSFWGAANDEQKLTWNILLLYISNYSSVKVPHLEWPVGCFQKGFRTFSFLLIHWWYFGLACFEACFLLFHLDNAGRFCSNSLSSLSIEDLWFSCSLRRSHIQFLGWSRQQYLAQKESDSSQFLWAWSCSQSGPGEHFEWKSRRTQLWLEEIWGKASRSPRLGRRPRFFVVRCKCPSQHQPQTEQCLEMYCHRKMPENLTTILPKAAPALSKRATSAAQVLAPW